MKFDLRGFIDDAFDGVGVIFVCVAFVVLLPVSLPLALIGRLAHRCGLIKNWR